jgi:predicted transcriptional regulator
MSDLTLSYLMLSKKDAERYHQRFLELWFRTPRMKVDEICAKIGVSPNTMLRIFRDSRNKK